MCSKQQIYWNGWFDPAKTVRSAGSKHCRALAGGIVANSGCAARARGEFPAEVVFGRVGRFFPFTASQLREVIGVVRGRGPTATHTGRDPGGTPMDPQCTPRDPQGIPQGPRGDSQETTWASEGAQETPKGLPGDAQGHPKGTPVSPEGAPRHPKGPP